MKKSLLAIFVLFFISTLQNNAQLTPIEKGLQSITTDAIKAQLGFLASDWTEGRMAGEKGAYLSADYIAGILGLYGVKPGGDRLESRNLTNSSITAERSYFQNFVMLKTVPGEIQLLKVNSTEGETIRTSNFTYNVDFIWNTFPSGREIEAPVVFAGYGFKNDKLKFNDFSKIDLRGKFILKIAGSPGFAYEKLSRAELTASEREIESLAMTGGAAGIIEFTPGSGTVGYPLSKAFNNMSPAEYRPRPAGFSARYSLPGKTNPENLIRITVSAKTANEILNGTGISIEEYIKNADQNLVYQMPEITGKSISLNSTVNTSTVAVRNVIGIIEGNDPNQIIVLGAHYDHMGMSDGFIWNGADDNGSGTVGVMTIARAIMESGRKPQKTVIIALWTAEEEGLLGSRFYVQNLQYPLKNLRLNVNFDMISRYISEDEPNKVTMTYTSTCPGFKEITMANLKKYGIDLSVDYQPSADPPGGTDHRSFVAAGIPIMRFKPGHREEYHTPDDEISTINWDIMKKIIMISFTNVWELANSDW